MPHINLLPWREELRTAKQRQFTTIIAGAAICTALGVVFVHIQMTSQIESQNARNRYLETTIQQVEKEIEEIKTLKRDKERLLARMNVIQKLQSSRPEIVHLFEEIALATPKGVFLLNAARKATVLSITGVANSNDSVSEFMRNLDSSEWLTNPSLTVIDSARKDYPSSSWFQLNVRQSAPKEDKPEDQANSPG